MSHRPSSDDTPRPPATDADTTVAQLRGLMDRFVRQRAWQRFHTPKNLAMSVAIEAAELMEHFQWLTTEESTALENLDTEEIADEMADVACYLLSLANALNVDLSSAITKKMARNQQRYPPPEQ
ncbi:MAG: nucleotide pyrophosphohydrolase [Planctomycetota bacterium]|nr:MAG: nucleotide pyrophosphohydrolase [Planctomycetota bacterium]